MNAEPAAGRNHGGGGHVAAHGLRKKASPARSRRSGSDLIAQLTGDIMRKIAIMSVIAASFVVSPLAAIAQEPQPPAPTEEPAPAPEPTTDPSSDQTTEPAPAPRSEEHTSE